MRNARLTGLLLAGAELIGILVTVSPFHDETVDKIGMVATTLKLTEPGDFVMDSKGETIYRNRPFRYVRESMTNHRMQRGLIHDDIISRLIETGTPLATTTRMPHETRDFIKENYVPISWRLFVLGQVLRKADAPKKTCVFQVLVPQRYTLITPAGPPTGMLDDTPFTGPRELTAGKHRFVPETDPGEVVLIWAAALERGYSPFAEIKEDYQTPQD